MVRSCPFCSKCYCGRLDWSNVLEVHWRMWKWTCWTGKNVHTTVVLNTWAGVYIQECAWLASWLPIIIHCTCTFHVSGHSGVDKTVGHRTTSDQSCPISYRGQTKMPTVLNCKHNVISFYNEHAFKALSCQLNGLGCALFCSQTRKKTYKNQHVRLVCSF